MSAERLQDATAVLRQAVSRPQDRRRGRAGRPPRQDRLPRAGRHAGSSRRASPMSERLDLPHLLADQGGDRGRGDDAARGRQGAAHRRDVGAPAGVQERHGANARRAAQAVAGDHRRRCAAAHVGPEPSIVANCIGRGRCGCARRRLPQFVTNITRAPLMEDPGTRFRYSEGTTALGRLVEVLSGKPFDTFVTERILKPLGMNDTTFWVEGEAQRAARHRVSTRADRRALADRDRTRGAVHRAPGADRRRGRPGVDRAGLPALLPDAAEQGRARRRAPAEGHDGRR